jgi:hypothetical protein
MFLDVYQRRHSYFNVDFLPALHIPYERAPPCSDVSISNFDPHVLRTQVGYDKGGETKVRFGCHICDYKACM